MRRSVFIHRVLARATVVGAISLATGLVTVVNAQAPGTQPASATPPNPFAAIPTKPSVKRVPVSKAVFGDAGMIVNARDDGFIEIAAAGPQKTVLLQLRTLAARAWVDSTARMINAKVKRADSARVYRSDIAEYNTNGRMALMRKVVTPTVSQFSMSFTDDPTPGFSFPIEPEEADVFVAIVRKAVAQSAKMLEKDDTSAVSSDSAAKADSIAAVRAAKKKKPAAKPKASPPAKTDSTKPAAPKPA
jgi:hypothetical protein